MAFVHFKNFNVRLGVRTFSNTVQGPFNFVGGKRLCSQDPLEEFIVTEPATGHKLCDIQFSGKGDVNAAVENALSGYNKWSKFSGMERGNVLKAAAQSIRKNVKCLATLEVRDSGKPLWEAEYDILACADAFDYYGGIAPVIVGQHIPLANGNFAMVQREPLGVCVGIGAWNFPFLIASWKAAPALACGNAMVFKPSQFTPVSTVTLAEILSESGLPDGCFNVVQGGSTTGQLLCEHDDVRKVSFTGSVGTGTKVMTMCARKIKHVTLELGGKSPLVIFEDCDLENAVKAAIMGNFLSQGQVCSNATRVFVQKSILPKFIDKLVNYTKKFRIGDPFNEKTDVGATITREHADKVLQFIDIAQKEGAKVECGGEEVKMTDAKLANGIYLSPCVLSHCEDRMTVVNEEVFGAVASVLSFETEEEAVFRANRTSFGLAGGVFTSDVKRAHRVASAIQAGIVWINNYNLYPPEVPFGGYKMSGIGRENGLAVLDHYTQMKTIMVEMEDVDCPMVDK